MSWALVAACLWGLIANLAAMIPSRDDHWTRAWWLMATGIPILGWVIWTHGPVAGLVGLAAGGSVLRWPLIRATQHVRARMRGGALPPADPEA